MRLFGRVIWEVRQCGHVQLLWFVWLYVGNYNNYELLNIQRDNIIDIDELVDDDMIDTFSQIPLLGYQLEYHELLRCTLTQLFA